MTMWQQVRNWIGLSSADSTSSTANMSTTTNIRPPTPSSDLYDLVLDLNWERVIQHCRDHPVDAHFQEGDTLETPLYLACQWSPPLAVIQALIDANPSALHTTSREYRDLPLHVICRYPTTTVELLHAFLTPCPDTAGRSTKYGKTPLQIAWEFARPDCMKQQDRVPQTPDEHEQVQMFWAKILVLVNAVAASRQQLHSASLLPTTSSTSSTTQSTTTTTSLYQIHAVVSLGALACPYPVLEYVCNLYPDQLAQRDESGQLPLHLAVGPTPWSSDGKRKYKPREQAIIQLLLERYPQAARRRLVLTNEWQQQEPETEPCRGRRSKIMKRDRSRNSNRYPLHIAVANRHCWDGGVKDLFQAAPEILSVRDPVTHLYPFQLAAIPVRNNLRVDLTTIFKLLQQQPDLVTRTCQEDATTQ